MILRVGGDGQAGRALQRLGGGHPVRDRADAADALGQVGRVLGIASLEDVLEAPELGPGALGVGNLLHAPDGIDGYFHLQVSFNPGNRINYRYGCHLYSPVTVWIHGKFRTG